MQTLIYDKREHVPKHYAPMHQVVNRVLEPRGGACHAKVEEDCSQSSFTMRTPIHCLLQISDVEPKTPWALGFPKSGDGELSLRV